MIRFHDSGRCIPEFRALGLKQYQQVSLASSPQVPGESGRGQTPASLPPIGGPNSDYDADDPPNIAGRTSHPARALLNLAWWFLVAVLVILNLLLAGAIGTMGGPQWW